MASKSLALISIYLAFFTNAIIFTIVLPYGSKMVMSFGLADSRDAAGTWVGILTFSLMFGTSISSPFWGQLCDIWGRKPIIMIAMLSVAVFSIIFGFSANFLFALISRFLLGAMTPIAIVGKTVISEICTSSEQSSAMAWQNILWQIGMIVGSILGGLFESPQESGLVSSGIFADYPFLLPNVVTAILAALCLPMIYLTLWETLDKSHNRLSLINENNRSFWQIAKDPICLKPLSAYACFSSNSTGFHEIVTLWFWANINSGGFEMNPNEIGLILGVGSCLVLFIQKPVHNFICGKLGMVKTLHACLLLQIPSLMIFPLASALNKDNTIKWVMLCSMCAWWYLVLNIGFTAQVIIANNSIVAKERGRMNGISMTVGAMVRAFAPLVYGFIFSKTVESSWIFPFNYAASFYIMALLACLAYYSSRNIPSFLNSPIEEAIENKYVLINNSKSR
ncbi:unnamed protein product [Blepharisma stoltei]|uniref:Major facilitator superfamily (MFS) profile domain-containing protein n=1 Tax=Blepharisma stoltei TaxID=1481888 RepID=A0AAU9JEN3_9CILI|nr:unnamed protein product [Blepharisma stoltei]